MTGQPQPHPKDIVKLDFIPYKGRKDADMGGLGVDLYCFDRGYAKKNILKGQTFNGAFAQSDCFGEMKLDSSQDPFTASTDSKTGVKESEAAMLTLGQICAYSGITLHSSFRKHLFTFLVTGNTMRFIRWDRRGAVVTRAFNYAERHATVFGFFTRYCQLTRQQRGFEPSVSPVHPLS